MKKKKPTKAFEQQMVKRVLEQSTDLRNQKATDLSKDKYDMLKKIFNACILDVCPQFKATPALSKTLTLIFYWCIGIQGELALDKGLWLLGSIGSSKSTILLIANDVSGWIGGRTLGRKRIVMGNG